MNSLTCTHARTHPRSPLSNGCIAGMIMFHSVHNYLSRLNNGYVSFVQFVCIHAFLCHRSCTRAHLFADLMVCHWKNVCRRPAGMRDESRRKGRKSEFEKDWICAMNVAVDSKVFLPHQWWIVSTEHENISVNERIKPAKWSVCVCV